ncbi:speckle-type POZ protein-like [Nasonia vitripennis]|uniref:Roadkill n=1 Tax=Nasonia vitripennis TaxID=7425 RepID=A0A7M7H102_NASVI|nr:speckle-type POZ protein-like [Nasonia vitripennis]XP_008202412.1 speckle-type POZ protein-like [Nasonia vitripennis]
MAPTKFKSNKLGEVNSTSSTIKWHIPNFDRRCNQAKVGKIIKSPKFTTITSLAKRKWHFKLCPRGQKKEHKDFLSLYLYTEFKQKFEAITNFKVLDKNAQVIIDRTLEEADYGEAAWGIHKLISTEFISNPENQMLDNGSLTIICEIQTVASQYNANELKPTKEVEEREDAFASQLQVLNMLEGLLNDSKFMDTVIVSEDKTIRAHKCILAKSSSVFAAMFNAEINERKEIILEVHDISYDVLVEMIRFIYTGKVNRIENMIEDLAIAANKFALHRLMIICEEAMIKCLSIHNVVNSLLVADKLKMKELKAMAIEFVVMSGSNAIDQENFRTLPMDVVVEVCSGLAKKYKD